MRHAPDGGRHRRDDYTGCRRGSDVQLYSVTDGGHTWPGAIDVPRLGPVTTEIDAADLILDFFDDHQPRRRLS
jgi:polyhydroxybutyrate depolymerase